MADYLYRIVDSVDLPGHAVDGTVKCSVNIRIISNEELVYEGHVNVNRNVCGDFPDIESITPTVTSQTTLNRIITDMKKLSSLLSEHP